MKKFLSSIIVLLFAFSVNAATITKGLIGEQDFKKYDGVSSTFSRTTSTGGTITLNKVGYTVDTLMVYGDGDSYTDSTINNAINAIGSNKVELVLRTGTWTIDNNVTIPSTITLTFQPGALLSVGSGKTITINGDVNAGNYQIFSGSGTVSGLTANSNINALWFGSFTSTAVTAALTTLGTTNKATLALPPGTWVISSNTDWSAYTNVTFKFAQGAVISQGAFTLKLPCPIIYPEWFGNKADDSTDNTTALQNALNAAPVGAIVKIPLGISRFTNLTIDTTNITLEGDGWGCVLATTMAANSDTAPAIWVKASGVQLRNFKVTWATLPTAAQYGTSVEENDVIAIGTIAYGPPTPAKLSNVTVDNVYVYGGKQHGISLGNTDSAKIINNRIEEVYGTGIWPYNSNNLRVTGNYVYRTADAGIDVTSDLVTYSDDVIISNNNVQKTAIGIGSHGGRGVTISDNVIDNTWGSAIYCQESAFYGNPVPSITNVTGNVIRKPFQFYGTGNFHTLDKYTTAAGTYNIIEVYSQSEVNVSGNIINDDADLHTYRVMGIGGTHISITGNVVNSTAAAGIAVGYGTASDYSSNTYLSIAGNVITLNNDAAQWMLFLQSVNGGVISGNHFDCGSGTVYPNGKFINTFWAKDILVTGNNVQNSTARWVDNGNSKNFRFEKNYGILNDTEIVTQPTLIDVSAVSPATLTIAHLQSTFIYASHTTGSTKTYTLPTGTLTDAGVNLLVGEGFEWIFGNYSAAAADTITVAAGVDHTIWGSGVIQSQNATTGGLYGCVGKFRTVKTAANTFITYRIN